MGSFSWVRADTTTKRANLTTGDKYKILVPKRFGGGYIKDIYWDYGKVGEYVDKGYTEYVDGNGVPHDISQYIRGCQQDLYGILAYWNYCDGVVWAGKDDGVERPKDMLDILRYGKTSNQTNRGKGIFMAKEDIFFPLKLVSAGYEKTYEECSGFSYDDPNQGFFKGYWDKVPYKKFYDWLVAAEYAYVNRGYINI